MIVAKFGPSHFKEIYTSRRRKCGFLLCDRAFKRFANDELPVQWSPTVAAAGECRCPSTLCPPRGSSYGTGLLE
jgi:hypothetical protein